MPSSALPPNPREHEAAIALLRWYVEMGADEAIGAEPANRFAPPPAVREAAPAPVAPPPRPAAARAVPAAPPKALAESPAEAAQSARRLAANADTVAALAALVAGFDGCALKHTATNTVFADGNPSAPVMEPTKDRRTPSRPPASFDRMRRRRLTAKCADHYGHPLAPPGNRRRLRPRSSPALCAAPCGAGGPRSWCRAAAPRPAHCCRKARHPRLRGRRSTCDPGLDKPVPTLPMFHPSLSAACAGRKRVA